MTGRPAPSTPRGGPPAGPWPPSALPGLQVYMGEHTRPWAPDRGRWLHHPAAELRCPHGCRAYASGAQAVVTFLATLAARHAPGCPLHRHEGDDHA